jgi:hypothetical protein
MHLDATLSSGSAGKPAISEPAARLFSNGIDLLRNGDHRSVKSWDVVGAQDFSCESYRNDTLVEARTKYRSYNRLLFPSSGENQLIGFGRISTSAVEITRCSMKRFAEKVVGSNDVTLVWGETESREMAVC